MKEPKFKVGEVCLLGPNRLGLSGEVIIARIFKPGDVVTCRTSGFAYMLETSIHDADDSRELLVAESKLWKKHEPGTAFDLLMLSLKAK